VNIPLGLVLLGLMGIGPVIGWRKASARNLRRNFTLPLAVGASVGLLLFALGIRNLYALLTFALGSFTMTTIVVEFWKGTRARARIEGEGPLRALVSLVGKNRRRYGGYTAHAGLVVMFMGFAGSAFDVEKQAGLLPGESVELPSPYGHSYTITYEDLSWYPAPNMTKLVASVRVERNGRFLTMMSPERRAYRQREEVTSHVGIRRAWNEDLYLILAGVDDPNGVIRGDVERPFVTLRLLVNPLVTWIWIGAWIIAIGTATAFWPERRAPSGPRAPAPPPAARRSEPRRAEEEEEELVGA
jgi:cytochrome c-type biogenesis protein CcmF